MGALFFIPHGGLWSAYLTVIQGFTRLCKTPGFAGGYLLSLKCSTWSACMVAGSVGTGDYRAVTFYLLRLFYLIFPFSFLKKILAKCGIRFNIFVCNPFWGKRSVL